MNMTGQTPSAGIDNLSPHLQTLGGKLSFTLPATWQISRIASFKEPVSTPDAADLTRTALSNPVEKAPLSNLLSSHHSVCILIEDLTRTSPKRVLLHHVLEELQKIGIADSNISIVIALGTHRPLSQNELAGAFGRETVARYSFVNHDCRSDDLVPIGSLNSGTPVKINKLAANATFCLGIGSIFPHPLNGFGGGGKIMFPGVADLDSIFEHHLRHSFRNLAYLGNMAGNSFYEEITSLARDGGLDFIVNSVLDHNDRLHQIVCGDPVAAHIAGTELCRAIISRHFPCKTDVTIISAFPYSEGPQIMKPLAPASMITRDRGWVILYADCRTPLSDEYFKACSQFRQKHKGRLREAVLEKFAANSCIMEDAPPELNMSMAQLMLGINDFNIILVCPDINHEQAEQLGFRSAPDIDAAITLCSQHISNPAVNIIPAGGVILPVLEQ